MSTVSCPCCGARLELVASKEHAVPPARAGVNRDRQPNTRGPIPRDKALASVWPFGKFKGEVVEDLLKEQPAYMAWALENLEPGYAKSLAQAVLASDDGAKVRTEQSKPSPSLFRETDTEIPF